MNREVGDGARWCYAESDENETGARGGASFMEEQECG